MFSTQSFPELSFPTLLDCIALEEAQRLIDEPITPQTSSSNIDADKFSKVLAIHSVLKKNIKPVISILVLSTNETYSSLAIFQYIFKLTSPKRTTDIDGYIPQIDCNKIWEIGKLFDYQKQIESYETLYNSKSTRLIESNSLEFFLNAVSCRSNDLVNKDTKSLSKYATIFEKKIEKITIPTKNENKPTITSHHLKPYSISLTTTRLRDILQLLEGTANIKYILSFSASEIIFNSNISKTAIIFSIDTVKQNPNNSFIELLYLSIDPYLIIEAFAKIGISFTKHTYGQATQHAKHLTNDELLQFLGLEAYFDIAINELKNRGLL